MPATKPMFCRTQVESPDFSSGPSRSDKPCLSPDTSRYLQVMLYEISKGKQTPDLNCSPFVSTQPSFLHKSRPVWPVFISLVTTSDRTPPTSQNHPYTASSSHPAGISRSSNPLMAPPIPTYLLTTQINDRRRRTISCASTITNNYLDHKPRDPESHNASTTSRQTSPPLPSTADPNELSAY